MADNFENLGFQVRIDGADSAVSHLDKINNRLEKFSATALSVKKSQISLANAQISLANANKSFETAQLRAESASTAYQNALKRQENAQEKLNDLLQSGNATELQLLLAQNNLEIATNNVATSLNTELTALINLEKAKNQLEKSTNAVATAELNLQNALDKEKQKQDKVKNSIDEKIDSQEKEEKQVKKTTNALSKYIGKLTSITVLARKVGKFMADAVKETANYTENLVLFQTAFGTSSKEQLEWALGIADAYGLARNEVVKFAGTFRQLSSSLGIVGDTADLVSKTVTNLGYDFSALFNTSVEDAMDALQTSIFAGQSKPLRRYGIDISQTQIDALFETNEQLANLNVNSRNLTQADKAIARLIITLQGGKNSFGVMAEEINNLQSQIRIFQGSLSNLKLAIGDLINEPLRDAMVYINGFIIGITKVIRLFAPKKEENTILDNVVDGAEEAENAIDAVQGKLADFDKFNVLGGQSSGASSNIAVTEALNQLLIEQASIYESEINQALEEINNKAVEIGNKIRDWFVIIDEEGNFVELNDKVQILLNTLSSIALVPLFNKLSSITLKLVTNFNLMNTASSLLGGVGIFLILKNVIDLIKNWDELDGKGKAIRITMIAVGAALVTFSTLTKIALKDTTLLTTAFKLQKIAAVGLAVGGIGLLVANLTNLIGNWDEMTTFEKVVGIFGAIGAAALTAAAGVAAFHGAWTMGTAAVAIVGALAAISAAFIAFKKDTKVEGFADGGYTNANLIMTHENGKREWVGKAAGSSAIVNDTQMSDIMEVAVAKGVYNALSTRSEMYGNDNETIVIKIGEEAVFNAVRKTAKRRGKDFANA